MNILVTGGAGYIGSHTVRALQQAGYTPIIVDNLSRGHIESIPDGVTFYNWCYAFCSPLSSWGVHGKPSYLL